MQSEVTSILLFLNTLNLLEGSDRLGVASGLSEWFREDVLGSPWEISLQDVVWAVEFREALRSLASINSGGAPSPAALEVVNRAARSALLRLRFSPEGRSSLDSMGPGLDGTIGRLLAAMHMAMTDGSWSRIKICRNPACRWAYYDRSRNRSRVWCEMAECGNRMKARRLRRRRSGCSEV